MIPPTVGEYIDLLGTERLLELLDLIGTENLYKLSKQFHLPAYKIKVVRDAYCESRSYVKPDIEEYIKERSKLRILKGA